jgi:hypothetical protein
MPLIPQQGRPLDSFYRDAAASSDEMTAAQGTAMLRLLPGLEEICAHRQVWGLTSHNNLCLLSADDWRSPWWVVIVPHEGSYEVRYLMDESDRPWPDALVAGSTEDLSQALEMIRIAMTRSGGWR